MQTIVIEFAGWVKLDAKDAKFKAIKDGIPEVINGEFWLVLNKEFRNKYYILDDIVDAQKNAIDGEYSQIEISDVNEE
jgi:hypothetical protein